MKDPVEARADESEDLYDVASWEPRSRLDRLAVKTHRGVLRAGRALIIALGIFIMLLILGGGAAAAFFDNPFILALVGLSVVPAGLLALYIYTTDITTNEPASLLAATFVLAILFAGFAAIINSTFSSILGVQGGGIVGAISIPGLQLLAMVLFYYLIVGPGEEAVKLLAVRLHAYRDDRFDSVIDGAVYGAVAGLGFASIENVLYITQNLTAPSAIMTQAAAGYTTAFLQTLDAGGEIAAVRGLAGPGHVIYSAFAGYYLGLAKFNQQNAGPIVAKGLLIAAFIHGTYNILVGIVPTLVSAFLPIPVFIVFVAFVVVYDGVFFYILYRKIARYRKTYARVHDDMENHESVSPEMTEFDADTNE